MLPAVSTSKVDVLSWAGGRCLSRPLHPPGAQSTAESNFGATPSCQSLTKERNRSVPRDRHCRDRVCGRAFLGRVGQGRVGRGGLGRVGAGRPQPHISPSLGHVHILDPILPDRKGRSSSKAGPRPCQGPAGRVASSRQENGTDSQDSKGGGAKKRD